MRLKVEAESSKQLGRHFVAKCKVPPGTELLRDEVCVCVCDI